MFTQYKNQLTAVLVTIILSVVIVASVLILSNTNIYIKNLGSSSVQNGQLVNTISVSGEGKVFAKPDMAELTISISETAQTSGEALQNANKKIDEVMTVLKSNAISPDDVQTSQFSVYPDYDYNSGSPIIKDQRATISLDVKIKKIDDKATKATQIIDGVSKIDNVQLGSITFDVEDRTPILAQAREQAYAKAKAKADQLSSLAGVKLLSPVSISDSSADITPVTYNSNASFDIAAPKAAGGSQISTGQLEIDLNLSVVYGIQ